MLDGRLVEASRLPAASAAATTTAAATTAAAASSATASAAAPSATASAAFTGSRFVHDECASANRVPVECTDRGVCFAVVAHLDECKSARLSALAIGDDRRGINRAVRREHFAEVGLGGAKREIANVNFLHDRNTLARDS